MNKIGNYKQYDIYSACSAQDHSIYCEIGPYATNRAIIKELEGPIYDDSNYIWLVVKDKEKTIAISSIDFSRIEKGIAAFGLTYVNSGYRRLGIYRHLFSLKQKTCRDKGAKSIRGLANPLSAILFDQNGFCVTSERGKWKHYEKEIHDVK